MRWALWVGRGAALAGALAFVALAATRRLNFDEALALRAGGLELSGADAAPAFVMPWTLALGALARGLGDPGAVFLVARLVATLGILALLATALTALGLSGVRWALAAVLTLVQAAFAVHGLEFRYDAALLAGLLLVVVALGPRRGPHPVLAGAAVTLLALHHVKGLALAALAFVWLWLRLGELPRGRARFAAGVGVSAGAWVAILALAGLAGRWLETLREFATLASGVTRVPFAEALGATVRRDLAWWILALAGVGAALVALLRRETPDRGEQTALALGLPALAVVLLHPHPWPYMLALPAPFLAAVVARRFPSPRSRPRRAAVWGLLAIAALAVQALAGASPLAVWREGFAAPRAPEVEALRRLRSVARPDEGVLDPSGLVYFLPPCTREWYTDTLFAERAARGEWMTELAAGVPATCVWVLNTYRLDALPPVAKGTLAREFLLTDSAVAARRAERRAALLSDIAGKPAGRIESYW